MFEKFFYCSLISEYFNKLSAFIRSIKYQSFHEILIDQKISIFPITPVIVSSTNIKLVGAT